MESPSIASPKSVTSPPVQNGGATRADWKRTPSTFLSFIKGFEPFPTRTPATVNPTIVFDAIRCCDHAKVKQVLMSDGDVNVLNASGSTLCHEAIKTGDCRMLEVVLAFHPDINRREFASVGGASPLHVAVAQGSLQMVNLLLQANADPTSRDDAMGSTPLHIAARKGYTDICVALLDAGSKHPGPNGEPLRDAYADMSDCQGKGAYYWAKEFGYHDIADMLPVRLYDCLAQLDLNKKTNPVWGPKKPKKKVAKDKDKKGGKGGKAAAGSKKK